MPGPQATLEPPPTAVDSPADRPGRDAAPAFDPSDRDQERAFLAAILESAQDAIIGKTLDGTIVSWNRGAERLYGYAAAEVRGRSVDLLVPPELTGEVQRLIARLRRGEVIREYRTVRLRKDGTRVAVAVILSPIRDAAGAVVGASAIARDLTDRLAADGAIQRLNAELEQRVRDRTAALEAANQELEAFAYSVSHDLRAPLRAIDGFARILLKEYLATLPEKPRHYLQMLGDNAQQMGRLIDDLLRFSRLNRQALRKETVATAALVRQCLQDLAPEQEGRAVEWVIGDLPPCEADPALLKQVWMNLLGNALKYTRGRTPARIEVGCRADGGRAVYYVRDNGVGFDMEYADKLFGVFQRLHNAEDYEGTGVGLAIVQRILHRHGGRAWAEARPDEGATFSLTLGGGDPHARA